jgi:type III secretion protein Q
MAPDVRDVPWHALPSASARDGELVAALASWTGASGRAVAAVPGIGEVRLAIGRAHRLSGPALAARLADPTAVAVVVRAGSVAAHLVAPAELVRSLGQRLLGGPDELAAGRPTTPAERGAFLYAAAAVAAALTPRAQVEPTSATPAGLGAAAEATVVDIVVGGAAIGQLALVVPPSLALSRRWQALASLAGGRGAWLDEAEVEAVAVVATCALTAAEIAGLRRRDVVVVDRVGDVDSVQLRTARGWIPARLASNQSGLTVNGAYERGTFVQESLGDDATIEVQVAAGTVTLSVRRLLELAPGQVLSLGRPLGGPVELRVGRRVIGRGELVDVDGELGVRMVAIDEPLVPPA